MRRAFDMSVFELWDTLPALAQDTLLVIGLLSPVLVFGIGLTAGFRVSPSLRALLRSRKESASLLLALIAVSVALAQAVALQERAMRASTAKAVDAFDVIVTVPAGDVSALLATVFLQPGALSLLDDSVGERLLARDDLELVAPLAFGDSVDGYPIVGTTPAMVSAWLDAAGVSNTLPELVQLNRPNQALVGAGTRFAAGDSLIPMHGSGMNFAAVAHSNATLTVSARLPATGTPWDRAVLVPVEAVWLAHGLGDGSAPGPSPGVPAFVVRGRDLGAAYAVRAAFTNESSMAFFPGEVLSRLHGLLGDAGQWVGWLNTIMQVLVVIAVMLALTMLMRTLAPRFAMLRALGAPARFVFALVWSFSFALVLFGGVLGLALGWVLALAVSPWLSSLTALSLQPTFALTDLVPVATLWLGGAALATVPAFASIRREPAAELRGG